MAQDAFSSSSSERLYSELKRDAKSLIEDLEQHVAPWGDAIAANLKRERRTKTVTDPVWGAIQLEADELAVIDSPAIQRLRGIRQLGLAHLVYPSAGHSRFEHSLGVVEAVERMLQRLEKQPSQCDSERFSVQPEHRMAFRLAALLHDAGHGPFSHLSEAALVKAYESEWREVRRVMESGFPGGGTGPAEIISAILVMSPALSPLWTRFTVTDPAAFVAARILGSTVHCGPTNMPLSGLARLLSGQLDADKLDYLSRDSHHSGLAIGLEVERILSKLMLVRVTKNNALNDEMKARAETDCYYQLGLARSGTGGLEQMVMARMVLFDRLYHHHKIRASEAMIAEYLGGEGLRVSEFLSLDSDEAFLAGRMRNTNRRFHSVAQQVRARRVYHRCFTLAARFLGGFDEPWLRETMKAKWNEITSALEKPDRREELTRAIVERGCEIANAIDDFKEMAPQAEDVILDLPKNKAVVRSDQLLVGDSHGHIALPSTIFDAQSWIDAYGTRKLKGFVYGQETQRPLVSLAAQVVMAAEFGVVLNLDGHAEAKTKPHNGKVDQLVEHGIINQSVAQRLRDQRSTLLPLSGNLEFPDRWMQGGKHPHRAQDLAKKFNKILPDGVTSEVRGMTQALIEHLASFIDTQYSGGRYKEQEYGRWEKGKLQADLRDHMRARRANVAEGSEVAGGETDLVFEGTLVIENKLGKKTADPITECLKHVGQVRRYEKAAPCKVSCVVLAYEGEPLDLALSIDIHEVTGGALICAVLPYGYGNPSSAKA